LRSLLGYRADTGRDRDSSTENAGSDRRSPTTGRAPPRQASFGQRRAPSLVRELIQALLLQPELARSGDVPQPSDGTPDGAALAALVMYCAGTDQALTTAGVMQYFAQTQHEPVLATALAAAEDHGITAEHAALHLSTGVARYWQQAQRAGHPGAPVSGATPSPEEAERLRQLEMVRRTVPSPFAKTSRDR
jgi:DNA primase DnaG DnaB-binding